MIQAASFGDMPQGPYGTEAELLAALTAWAGDPNTDGGAFSIAERGERLLPGNSSRGATRRVRCDRSGKPRSNGKSRDNTLSKKCNCPWEVWIEEAQEGWVTSVFSKVARERALEMRATSIHQIHKHPLLDTAVSPAVRLKRRKDTPEAEEGADIEEGTEDGDNNKDSNKQKIVNKRSMQEILEERDILMKGGARPSIRNGGKPVQDEKQKKAQAAWERKTKRLAIYHYYVNILGSPPPHKWKKQKASGQDGTIGIIQKALKIPHGQRNMIENVLQQVTRCHELGVEYTGERAQHTGRSLGRPVLIPTDSEDAKVIAQAYQDGTSVKKTVVLVNQRRKERDGNDAAETTESAVYSCLNRLKEESLASPKMNSSSVKGQHVNTNRPVRMVAGIGGNRPENNNPFGRVGPLNENYNQTVQDETDLNEQRSGNISSTTQEKQDAKSWNDLMMALRNRGHDCSSVDEIAEAFVAGKQQLRDEEDANTNARKRQRVESKEDDLSTLPGGDDLPRTTLEGLGEYQELE